MKNEDRIAQIRAQINMPKDVREKAIAILTRLDEQEKMAKSTILEYARHIRPLIRGTEERVALAPQYKNKELFWARPTKIATESFTFNHKTGLMKAEGLTEIGRITTYHNYGGYSAFLRPSTHEAIGQCPKEWLDKVVAFEFQTDSDKFEDVYDYMLDRHVLTTIYYTGTLPEEIHNLPVEW